jgi:hypothetical protein
MPEQFVVPQFIDAEDKILGPITARQFVIMLVVFLLVALFFRLFSFTVFLLTGIPLFAFGVIVSFVKINGQHFHYFLLNIIQTFKKPNLRIWDKRLSAGELKRYMKEELPPPPEIFVRKAGVAKSRLQELTLVVNTGGLYQPDEE